MELNSSRLEGSSRIQERTFGQSEQERKRRAAPPPKDPGVPAENEELAAEPEERHSLDDMA